MKTALILYNSKTGRTKKLGENIRYLLENNNIKSEIKPIEEFQGTEMSDTDFVFFGSWTNGLMIFLQGPDKKWVEFVEKLAPLNGVKTVLFTTYLLSTGSMFRNMKKHLKLINESDFVCSIKSRDGNLNDENKNKILELINSNGSAVSDRF
jgi:flavodoxin